MIRYLKYSEIDFEKFERCVENSVQRNFYVSKENLDFLCKKWELLVMDDYKAVMPVPFTSKFGLKVILMPLFAQQFGIFSKEDDVAVNDAFLKYIQKHFNILYYAFNFKNQFSENLLKRKNYLIKNIEYTELRRKYTKGRKHAAKSAQYLDFKTIELNESVEEFILKNQKGLDKKADFDKFIKYLHFLNERKILKLVASIENDEVNTLAIMIDKNDELSLLSLVSSKNQKEKNGASFLIDRILQENIPAKSFNFMGSSIPGVELFFKSFGAENFEYPVIFNSKTKFITSLFFK